MKEILTTRELLNEYDKHIKFKEDGSFTKEAEEFLEMKWRLVE